MAQLIQQFRMLWLMVRLKELHLSRLAGSAEIDRGQFYHPIADSMEYRMQPDSEKTYLQAIDTVLPATLGASVTLEYRESQLKDLCTKFEVLFSGGSKGR